jgi:predicted DNA-binding helix-hairpin-helix protein
MREHRLYQADWLMRFYGFSVEEIAEEAGGMLALDIDPKLAWALRHRERFPVDVNRADRETLLRVPGLGKKTVTRILASRGQRTICADDLARLGVSLGKVTPFLKLPGHRAGGALIDALDLKQRLIGRQQQLSLAL